MPAPAMCPPPGPSPALEARQESFERTWWKTRPPEAPPPRWEEFLPAVDQPCTSEFAFLLVQTDIEFRVRAGLPALLAEPYFAHPRLQLADARLGPDRQVELVRWEYQQRWKRGDRAARAVYLERFPEHAAALQDLRPRWNCPRCKRAGVPLRDEAAAMATCPSCQQTHPIDDLFPPPSVLVTPPPTQAGGLDLRAYELLEPLGRGGMGEVYRSRDPGLGRDLALKVLRPECQGHEAEARFEQEARITGSLQHPGIVPVHNLGRLRDGRLYFTMKVVRGGTFAEVLHQPGERTAVRRAADVAVFEKVCQTLAYAHSKGVIHRDLKPSNVMVGAFGEVQVMDWGLAKVLKRPEGQPALAATVTASDLVRTEAPTPESRAGDVMGTAAYMAPEAAGGAVEQLDERCDVFGLGALLCEVLTGLPPYTGPTAWVVRDLARRAELGPALTRLDCCGADAELVALAKRCLEVELAKRPRHAGALAAELTAYLESVEVRLRQAELERAQAQVKAAEERKRRKVQLALAAAVLLLFVGGATAGWLVQQQSQARRSEAAERQRKADAVAVQALGEAQQLLKQARTGPLGDAGRFREALTAARTAEELARTSEASAEVRQQAEELVEAVKGEADAAGRDRRLLAALLEVRGPREGPRFKTDDKGLLLTLAEPSADQQFRSAFIGWGLDVDWTPIGEAAKRLRARPAAVVVEVTAALDEWASERREQGKPAEEWQRVAALAQALDSDSSSKRRELRALLARGNLDRERGLGALLMALRPVPVPFDVGWGEDRTRLRKLAAATDAASEPVLGVLTLARALRVAGEQAEAERLLRAALDARPREVVLHQTLGKMLEENTPPRWDKAVEHYRAARAVRAELGESLAYALVQVGRGKEGLALYERLTAEQPRSPWLHLRSGNAFYARKRYVEAEGAYRKAIALKHNYPEAHSNLGGALAAQKRYTEAEAAYHKAIALQHDNPPVHNNLGVTFNAQKRYAKAEASIRKAIELQHNYPGAHVNLSIALRNQERYAEAEAACRQAITLQHDFPEAHVSLGDALLPQKRYVEAEVAYRKAVALKYDHPSVHLNLGIALLHLKRPVEAEAASRQAIALKRNSPEAYANLGNTLKEQKRYAEAEASYRKAIALKHDYPDAHFNLGNVLYAQQKHVKAEAEYRKAIALKNDFPDAYSNLGIVLSAQERYVEAEAACRKAIALKPQSPEAHVNLGTVLLDQKKYAEAEASYRKAISLKYDYPAAHTNLGSVLFDQKRYVDAEASFRKAIAHQHDYPEAHFNLGNALRAQNRNAEAEIAFRKAIALKQDYPKAHNNLGNALLPQKRYTEAEAAYRQAIALKPDSPEAHLNLGIALYGRKKYVEAEGSYRKAIALKHDLPRAHLNLGSALAFQKRYAEAEGSYRKAIALQPDYPEAHLNLGFALADQKRYAGAEAAFRKAIELQHNYPEVLYSLGNTLGTQEKYAEAEAAFRKAIALRPGYAEAHANLGIALSSQEKYAEAVGAYRKALALRNNDPVTYCHLGGALTRQGRFPEVLEAYRTGHALGSKLPGWSSPSAAWVRRAERLVTLDQFLPKVLDGKAKPASASEGLELASLCQLPCKRLHAAAARLATDAFAIDPKLAEDLEEQYRYYAAWSAALAAAGQAEDAKGLADRERAALRGQALAWLRADLASYAKLVKAGNSQTKEAVRRRLRFWQAEADLASVRSPAALAKLPAEERKAWQQLWAEVAALRKRAEEKQREKPGAPPP